MMPFLSMPPPTWLRRRPEVEPWPGNPRTVADDLRESLAHEAELAAQLTAARQESDVQAARAAAFERRAAEAETAHQDAAAELILARAELWDVRKDRDALRKQLDSALGYDAADLAAINNGTGQPRKAGQ